MDDRHQDNGIGAPVERGGQIVKARDVIFARENGQIDLVDRKVFDYLLNRVYAELQVGSETVHRLPVRDILQFLRHSSADRLRESLSRLARVDIELRYEDGGVRKEGVVHYLSYLMENSTDGWLEFSFDQLLIRCLHKPKVFGMLQAGHVQKFRSNYASHLYEFMAVYVNRRKPEWTVTIEEFRDLMGVGDLYPRWDNLKSRVIQPAVDEASELAMFHIEWTALRAGKGGKVTGLRFTARAKGPVTLLGMHDEFKETRRSAPRDPDTIDMLDGRTDAERDPYEISAEATELASAQMGEGKALEGYLERWRTDTAGRRIFNADRSFLNWLDLVLQRERDSAMNILEADTLAGLVEDWEGSK